MTDLDGKLKDAIDGQIISGKDVAAQRHPWTTDPIPMPKKPPASVFKLTVENHSGAQCEAKCEHMDPLLDLATQFEYLSYRFMRLERIVTGD